MPYKYIHYKWSSRNIIQVIFHKLSYKWPYWSYPWTCFILTQLSPEEQELIWSTKSLTNSGRKIYIVRFVVIVFISYFVYKISLKLKEIKIPYAIPNIFSNLKSFIKNSAYVSTNLLQQRVSRIKAYHHCLHFTYVSFLLSLSPIFIWDSPKPGKIPIIIRLHLEARLTTL